MSQKETEGERERRERESARARECVCERNHEKARTARSTQRSRDHRKPTCCEKLAETRQDAESRGRTLKNPGDWRDLTSLRTCKNVKT